jgi:hypothetical protein
MIALELFSWWYGAGWKQLFSRTNRNLAALGEAFSAGTLLKTLFAPWKRIITYPGAGLDAHLHAFIDNLVSRAIGFVVRIFVLVAFVFLSVLTLLLNAVMLVIWPLVPLGIVATIVKGLI